MIMSKKKRPFFAHYAKIFRNEFKGYNTKYLINDMTSGITVGAVALPLALAFGAASVDEVSYRDFSEEDHFRYPVLPERWRSSSVR